MLLKVLGLLIILSGLSVLVSAQTKGKYTYLFDEQKIKNTTRFIADDGFEVVHPERVRANFPPNLSPFNFNNSALNLPITAHIFNLFR